jgi:hypothetical protein
MKLFAEFQADRRFSSLVDAADFLKQEYLQELPRGVWKQQPSGLFVRESTPRYLFRGECGDYPITAAGIYRPSTYSLGDGTRLTGADREVIRDLIPALARRFSEGDYALDEHASIGLLQHYGLPTWIVDFTYNLGNAISFAATGSGIIGRICVIPTDQMARENRVIAVDLATHRWCERPRRQDAVGVVMPDDWRDLKNRDVRRELRAKWYEFPISDEDRRSVSTRYSDFLRLDDDPSAGFLRHHITEYVEARGKLSPTLTDWLIERVPMMPRCAEVIRSSGSDVEVQHRPPSALRQVDYSVEASWSKRYWSSVFTDCSWNRMTDWQFPPVGTVYADPRTFHPQNTRS